MSVELKTEKLSSEDYIELENRYGAHNYHPLDVVIRNASGVWVYDVEGRKYLDCLAAYSAVIQGHCHPKIMAAALEQAGRVTLTSRAFRNDQLPLLLRDLHELTGMEMALPMNSGAEAVETALKCARKWGYTVKGISERKAEIIACANNFHGRTISVISFSTEAQYRFAFGPFTPGFKIIPYGDIDALRAAITPDTCAFLVEPIQGEGGIVVPRDGYLREAEDICRAENVLLIADEIQSGLGRTGKLFAHEWEGIHPDIVTVGKALGGGYYPISAMLASRKIMDVFHPGDHGSTFGGNPMACAVARAALKVLAEENMIERSAVMGAYMMDQFRRFGSPDVRDVRGRGLWIGLEMKSEARPYIEKLKGEGVLCKETRDTVIRVSPPLIISREEIDWALERFARVL
ncbi:MAG TPA: ornithine--oxo-acid transaminase [Candidatus Aminicenantes bacterium]|nr:ornithine--oxo-acid transaminase [Candidatus Aminicenantes bacterium]